MKKAALLFSITIVLFLVVPLAWPADLQEIDLLKTRQRAEEIIGKALYAEKYDDNVLVLIPSLYLIGKFKLARYSDKLEELYASLKEDDVGRAIAIGIWDPLARFGKKAYLEKEIKFALSSTGIKRIEAAHVLLENAPNEALSILRKSVYAKDFEEVFGAVEELAELKDPLAHRYLSKGLTNTSEDIVFQSAMTLTRGKWNDGEEIQKLRFRNGTTEQRMRAAGGLCRLGNDDAIRYMIA